MKYKKLNKLPCDRIPLIFKNKILIFDRLYHNYEFINFLYDNEINQIIRIKGK